LMLSCALASLDKNPSHLRVLNGFARELGSSGTQTPRRHAVSSADHEGERSGSFRGKVITKKREPKVQQVKGRFKDYTMTQRAPSAALNPTRSFSEKEATWLTLPLPRDAMFVALSARRRKHRNELWPRRELSCCS